MERDDTHIKLFAFGMNDDDGRLIEIKIPACNEDEAIRKIRKLLLFKLWEDDPKPYFWLNAVEEYR